jgi:hypothetical protein
MGRGTDGVQPGARHNPWAVTSPRTTSPSSTPESPAPTSARAVSPTPCPLPDRAREFDLAYRQFAAISAEGWLKSMTAAT